MNRYGCCSMCLDISPNRRYVREAVFPRGEIYVGVEPRLLVVPFDPPRDPLFENEVLIPPISNDDPLFQKWFGADEDSQ
jgi:hypothetical protein